MNRKIIVVGIIGLAALLVLFVIVVLVSSGGNKGNSDQILENSSEGKTSSVCKEVAGEATMIMKDDVYEPKDLEIKLCTKVTFKNNSSEPRWPASNIHPTHGIYPEFDPQEPVEVGQEWSFVFDREGRWKYHDHLKPLIVGTITVSK